MPRTRIGGYDVGVARPRLAGEAVRKLVEPGFQPRELTFGVGIEAQSVVRVLERRVVAAEIEALPVAHVGETVGGHTAAVPPVTVRIGYLASIWRNFCAGVL